MTASYPHLPPSSITGPGTLLNHPTPIKQPFVLIMLSGTPLCSASLPASKNERPLNELPFRLVGKLLACVGPMITNTTLTGRLSEGRKRRLVAQGFGQRPEDFGETYAPVVKLSSVRILLAFANHFDLEILNFDVKTAFLHARLPHDIFVKQIPGFPESDPSTVLRLLVALYGLKQSSHEWYKLLSTTLANLGLFRCEADHAVFMGRWTLPPHSSIPALPSADPLFLIIPIHVDDGLAITNSLPLYEWFVKEISTTIDFVSLGPVLNTRYLGQRIIRDRNNKTLHLSQSDLIVALLEDWAMTDCKTSSVPLHHNPINLPPPSPNACPDIPDDKLLSSYQRLVGSITYLAVCTCPDLAYAAMALGQLVPTLFVPKVFCVILPVQFL